MANLRNGIEAFTIPTGFDCGCQRRLQILYGRLYGIFLDLLRYLLPLTLVDVIFLNCALTFDSYLTHFYVTFNSLPVLLSSASVNMYPFKISS